MKKFFAIALGVLALASCSREAVPQKSVNSREVKFTTNVNTFTMKAGETSLDGKTINIFAGDPINVQKTATVSGSTVNLEEKIYWQDGQTARTSFGATYPEEQSAAVINYDLLYGGATSVDIAYHSTILVASAPNVVPEETVTLNFKHPFSLITIKVTNEIEDADVEGVVVGDVKSAGTIDVLAGTLTAAQGLSSIDATPVEGATDEYQVLVFPGSQKPAITVKVGENSYKFVLASSIDFQGNKSYTAEITVTASTTPVAEGGEVDFDVTVSDWEDADPLAYQPEDEVESNDGKWSVIGKLNGTSWDTDFWMTETSEGVWEVDITYLEGDSFKLRQDGKWTTGEEIHAEAGMPGEAEGYVPADGSEYGLWGSDNKDIVLAAPGEYHLKFLPNGYKFYVTSTSEPEPEPLDVSELYLIGAAAETGWAIDLMAAFTKDGNIFTLDAHLRANQIFRFLTQKVPNGWYPAIVQGATPGSVKLADDATNDEHFTVAVNGNYTITVDILERTVEFTLVKADPDVTVYAVDETGWEQLNLYLWGDINDLGGVWPGKESDGTKVEGDVTYKYYVFENVCKGITEHLIFNNTLGGEENQLDDYELTFDGVTTEYYFRVTAGGVYPAN